MHKFETGTIVNVEGWGLSGWTLQIDEQFDGPEGLPFYSLKAKHNGAPFPGRYDERLITRRRVRNQKGN